MANEPTLVPGYRHVPGNHCGSTALRNLLAFHGLDLSEEMVFGLGAGAGFFYVVVEGQSPSRFMNGRTQRLEHQFLQLTGLPLELETFGDDADASWEAARDAVATGRPPLLLTDLYYLDHYGNSAHFPGHAVVLAGHDSERAFLSDTAFPDLQETRLENLKRARHGTHPIFSLSGEMVTAREGAELGTVAGVAKRAIEVCAAGMLEPELGEFQGMPALRRFGAEIADWPSATDDWQWCARFCYQVIERRGTGGGNFRAMYSRFLAELADGGMDGLRDSAVLAGQCSEAWTELAAMTHASSERNAADADEWRAIGEQASRIGELEDRLWTGLARAV